METPTDDELREFVQAMLSNLDMAFREPEAIDEAIDEYRETWVLLYRTSLGFDLPDDGLGDRKRG